MVRAVARSLVTRRTNTIGVVVTTIADPFAGEVVSGIEEFFLPLLHAVNSFHQRRVDGILVMSSRVSVSMAEQN